MLLVLSLLILLYAFSVPLPPYYRITDDHPLTDPSDILPIHTYAYTCLSMDTVHMFAKARQQAGSGSAAYSSGRIAFRQQRNERRRHDQSIRMITSVTLRDMKRNSRGDLCRDENGSSREGEGTTEEVSLGNECKCIEIQIIILSRRIVCSIARSLSLRKGDGVLLHSCGGGSREKGNIDKARECCFLSSLYTLTCIC